MSARTVIATVNPKKRGSTTALILFYVALAIFSTVMGFFDIATDRQLFGVLFLIAAAIFYVLLLIKGNSIFGTNLKIQNGVLYMKRWVNGFLPYDVDGGFFSDLKPSKTAIVSVPAAEIEAVLIGSKEYIKRNMTESGRRFLKELYPYEHSSRKAKQAMIEGLDIFYAETKNGDCAFMCIENYTVKKVVDIISEIYNENPSVTIRVNNKEYKRYIMKLRNGDI